MPGLTCAGMVAHPVFGNPIISTSFFFFRLASPGMHFTTASTRHSIISRLCAEELAFLRQAFPGIPPLVGSEAIASTSLVSSQMPTRPVGPIGSGLTSP